MLFFAYSEISQIKIFTKNMEINIQKPKTGAPSAQFEKQFTDLLTASVSALLQGYDLSLFEVRAIFSSDGVNIQLHCIGERITNFYVQYKTQVEMKPSDVILSIEGRFRDIKLCNMVKAKLQPARATA